MFYTKKHRHTIYFSTDQWPKLNTLISNFKNYLLFRKKPDCINNWGYAFCDKDLELRENAGKKISKNNALNIKEQCTLRHTLSRGGLRRFL